MACAAVGAGVTERSVGGDGLEDSIRAARRGGMVAVAGLPAPGKFGERRCTIDG